MPPNKAVLTIKRAAILTQAFNSILLEEIFPLGDMGIVAP